MTPAFSTPDPPGPPGLVITDPIRCAVSVAGLRSTFSVTVAPVGSS